MIFFRYLPLTYASISKCWLALDLWTGRFVDLR